MKLQHFKTLIKDKEMQRDAGIKNAPRQIKNTLNLLILLIACLESAKYYNRIIFFFFICLIGN